MENILITGGAGFIGSNLALKLIKKGYHVTVLDNLSKQVHGDNPELSYTYKQIKNKVDFRLGDVNDREIWCSILPKIDIIIHLAAETGTGQSMYEVNKYIQVNIVGTGMMLEYLAQKAHHVKKILIASSRAVYGEGKYQCKEHGVVYPEARKDCDMKNGDYEVKCPICQKTVKMLPTDENAVLHPTSVYGFTKHAQEELGMILGKALNIPTVIFRFQNVYGPGQSLNNPYTGILSIFSTRIKNGNNINIFEDGLETRDFVYIDDVTDAIILGMEKKEADYKVFNVGSGELINVLTIADTLKENYKQNSSVQISGDYRLGDIRNNLADLTYINKDLGYYPSIKFKEGITNFVKWVDNQDICPDQYEASIEEMKRMGLFKENETCQ